jgi:hypothetical protein
MNSDESVTVKLDGEINLKDKIQYLVMKYAKILCVIRNEQGNFNLDLIFNHRPLNLDSHVYPDNRSCRS